MSTIPPSERFDLLVSEEELPTEMAELRIVLVPLASSAMKKWMGGPPSADTVPSVADLTWLIGNAATERGHHGS